MFLERDLMGSKLTTFEYDGKVLPVEFVETMDVKDGVVCDVYSFIGDTSKDLGIVTVKRGHKTPLQRVLKGDKTIEGFVSGTGVLTVKPKYGKERTYQFNEGSNTSYIEVGVGETMQWLADTDLIFYEVCYPPYSDGRFENLEP